MSLEEVSKDRNNNLNLLRFIAAILVIICHAYPLSQGKLAVDPLGQVTQGQIHLGGVAVCAFFFFSGFFLNRSANKGEGARLFFKCRCIRIFPSLIATVFLCVFGLGAFITNLRWNEYFGKLQTYEYLLNCLLVLKHDLPGVFEDNVYNSTVNGSLWTLPVEFLCYIGCFFHYRLGLSKESTMRYTIPFFVVGYVSMYTLLNQNQLFLSVLRPWSMFYCGMIFDTYRKRIHLKIKYLLLCIVGLIFSSLLGVLKYGEILFFPYILSYIVFGTEKKVSWFGMKHEISYGMYLCAWPIQQAVIFLFGGEMNVILNMIISLPFVIIMGLVLNICVEKPVVNRFGH